MLGPIVTLDIETTGLDHRRDRIIEIGAVRSEQGRETAVFQTYVNPGMPIPSFISDLTGIRDEHVADAPAVSEVITELSDFVGESPVLAHNASFDLAFLKAAGLRQPDLALDTVGLARILIPRAPRYGLGALADNLGIELIQAHRALDDARATSELYWELWKRACALPEEVLTEFCQLGEGIHWPPSHVFQAALTADPSAIRKEPSTRGNIAPAALKGAAISPDPAIIKQLTDCFRAREPVLLESGATPQVAVSSLFAAIAWIHQHGEPVMLVARDEDSLAMLRQLAEPLAAERDISWRELAAPGDFLSHSAWHSLRSFPPLDGSEIQFRARVLVWLAQGGNGNRRQIQLRGSTEESLWRRISGEQGRGENGSESYWENDLQQTENPPLILTSVSAWWSSLNDRNGSHPFHGPTIFFEATQMEAALTEVETIRLDAGFMERILLSLADPKVGLLDQLVHCGVSEAFGQLLISSLRNASLQAGALFHRFAELWERTDSNWLSIDSYFRSQAIFQPVLTETRQFCDQGDEVIAALDRLAAGIAKKQNVAELLIFMRGVRDELSRALECLRQGIVNPEGRVLCWLERNRWASSIQINSAPIRPGRLLAKKLLPGKAALIFLDDTISIGDDGQFWQERVGLPDLGWQSIQTSDHETIRTVVYIPQDIPAPNERTAYQRAMERSLLQIASENSGRTIALFTSIMHLRETALRLQPRLDLGGIQVFQVNQIDTFLGAERGLLLLSWRDYQKLSFPAGCCSVAALVRLPFDLPNLPLVAARSAEYEASFSDYSVPIAITRMLRALRKTQSLAKRAAAFVILDSRIVKKRYGECFLAALPEVQLQYGESTAAGTAIRQWLDQGAT